MDNINKSHLTWQEAVSTFNQPLGQPIEHNRSLND